jgi:hypothetical protein
MTKANDSPRWPSRDAELDGVNLTPLQRQRAERSLRRAEQLVGLLFATTSGLKQLVTLAIVNPVAVLRRRRGREAALTPAGKPGRHAFGTPGTR